MNNELWNEFKNKKAVINCKTKSEAKKFLTFCKSKGYKWFKGSDLIDNFTWGYEFKTCYWVVSGSDLTMDIAKSNIYKVVTHAEKIITYAELMEDNRKDKKTFTGLELAQAILNEQFKADTKFITADKREYSVWKNSEGKFNLFPFPINKQYTTDFMILAYDTFTLIEEPKRYFLNQVTDKKIKLKDWATYHFMKEAILNLGLEKKEIIQNALTKPVWEVEQ